MRDIIGRKYHFVDRSKSLALLSWRNPIKPYKSLYKIHLMRFIHIYNKRNGSNRLLLHRLFRRRRINKRRLPCEALLLQIPRLNSNSKKRDFDEMRIVSFIGSGRGFVEVFGHARRCFVIGD